MSEFTTHPYLVEAEIAYRRERLMGHRSRVPVRAARWRRHVKAAEKRA
jgi:hypothetical protein